MPGVYRDSVPHGVSDIEKVRGTLSGYCQGFYRTFAETVLPTRGLSGGREPSLERDFLHL